MVRRLIAYDVGSDCRRQKISRVLEKIGRRLQKSVFVVELTAELLASLERELQEMLEESDSLLVLPICRHCFAEAAFYGPKPPLLAAF